MMTGVVRAGEARVRLIVRGPRGKQQQIEAVIDTGYTAWLTLPPDLVGALGLAWKEFNRGILADGSECHFDVYKADVVWNRRTRHIFVHEADSDPLIGMALLNGFELRMQVRSGGKVTIKRLP